MQLERVIAEEAQGRRVSVWFGDEARFGQKNQLQRVWDKVGSRPRAPKDLRFSSEYIFGAICPADGRAAAVLLHKCNTTSMNIFLAEVAVHIKEDEHVVLIVDGAGWHKSNDLEIPDNMTLIILPPYSPELNPIERAWLYIRSHWLSNRVFRDITAVLDACEDAWKRFIADHERVRSVCRATWADMALEQTENIIYGCT